MKRTKTIQKEIAKAIDNFASKSDKMMGYEPNSKYSIVKSLLYWFHDDKSIAVDGMLYDILVYGCSDFGYGKELDTKINKLVHDAGYYLEYAGQGVYNIVEG